MRKSRLDVAARWAVLRLAVPPKPSARLGMGCIALLLLLYGNGICAVAPRANNSRVHCQPRPGCGNGVLCDARAVCHHASSVGQRCNRGADQR